MGDAADGGDELFRVERLDDPASRTGRAGASLLLVRAFGRQHEDRAIAVAAALAQALDEAEAAFFWLGVAFPSDLAPYFVSKGSVAVDGISLTVARLDRTTFDVALVPHTLAATTLGDLAAGDPVNLEADVIAKYVESMLERRTHD